MQILFPADPFNPKLPDSEYAEEFDAAVVAGIDCSVFRQEVLEFEDKLKTYPALKAGVPVLYRGWMMTIPEYEILEAAVISAGAFLITSTSQYSKVHHLPNWYPVCEQFTPRTIFAAEDSDFVKATEGLDWSAYFVKDYVKSLTTSRGSVAKSPSDISEVVSLIKQYRGRIEGGICIREFEEFEPNTEERYFVVNGIPHGRSGPVPDIVNKIAQLDIGSSFYSVDIVKAKSGELRLIELGDGQVSDKKQWTISQFVDILKF